MNDDDIQQIFFVECEEALEATENGLDACKAGTHDDETINAIFRGVHSIKGGAGAFGHTALASYTHCFENLLGDIREEKVPLSDALTDLLLLACDLLRDHVEAARGSGDVPDDKALMEKLEAARAGAPPEAPSEPQAGEAGDAEQAPAETSDDLDLDSLLDDLTGGADASPVEEAEAENPGWKIQLRPHAAAMANGGEPLLWLRELACLGGTCDACFTEDVPSLDEIKIDEGYIGWTVSMPGSVSREDVEEIFDFVGEDCGRAYDDEPFPSLKLSEQADSPQDSPVAQSTQTAPSPAKPDSAEPKAPAPAPTKQASAKAEPTASASKYVFIALTLLHLGNAKTDSEPVIWRKARHGRIREIEPKAVGQRDS